MKLPSIAREPARKLGPYIQGLHVYLKMASKKVAETDAEKLSSVLPIKNFRLNFRQHFRGVFASPMPEILLVLGGFSAGSPTGQERGEEPWGREVEDGGGEEEKRDEEEQ